MTLGACYSRVLGEKVSYERGTPAQGYMYLTYKKTLPRRTLP